MFQGQKVCVQRLAIEGRQGRPAAGAEVAGLGLEVRAIDGVAHQGVADMGEMDPDLVGAAGLELAGQQHRDRLAVAAVKRFLQLPMGDGVYGPHFKTKASRLGPQSQAALERLGRQALHAYLLALEHPKTGEILHWEVALPEDLLLLQRTLEAAQ